MKAFICLSLYFALASSSPFPNDDEKTQDNLVIWKHSLHRSEASGSEDTSNRCPYNDWLDCNKCPGDARCSVTKMPPISDFNGFWPFLDLPPDSEAAPKSKPMNRPRPFTWTYDPAEPAALTGPQLAGIDDLAALDSTQVGGVDAAETAGAEMIQKAAPISQPARTCPLESCSESGLLACSPSTTCINGYCACAEGLKAESGYQGRGWNNVATKVVFVNPGVSCQKQCVEIDCSEINSMSGCFQGGSGVTNKGHDEELGNSDLGKADPATSGQADDLNKPTDPDTVNLSNPVANQGASDRGTSSGLMSSDYVAGIASLDAIGETVQ